MNCKPGDLAMVVNSTCGNEGVIVTCLEYIGLMNWHGRDYRPKARPTWRIDRELPAFDGCHVGPFCKDEILRPIRDPGDDAVDESLAWTKTPTQKRQESQEAYDAAVRRRRQAEA